MSANHPLPHHPACSWNPHGFSEKDQVTPLSPPAVSRTGGFTVQTKATIKEMWREGSDYVLKLEDESGKEYSGTYWARDFQKA